ncbi:MAG TPA: hypothetical protein PKA07_01865 [Micropruina sp.]|nr:hypothetical protein [Micropruina sp.]
MASLLRNIVAPLPPNLRLSWDVASDEEIRNRAMGVVQIDHSYFGSGDDTRHVNAWDYARNATRKVALQYPARNFGPLSTPIAADFNGMNAVGPDGAPGTRGLELGGGNLVNHRIRVECGTGTNSLFVQTGTIQYVSFQNLAFSGSAGSQWWHNTNPNTASIYPLHMRNLTYDGFNSPLGNSTNKFTFTQGKIDGQWTVLNYQATPIHWGGSDNDISAYINSASPASVAGAGKPIFHWDYMEKTQVTGLVYITAENAWSGHRVEGPVERELRIFATVAEGRAAGNPATRPVWDIRGCHVILYAPSINYVVNTNANGAIVQSAGVLEVYSPHYRKATAAAADFPLFYQTGGLAHISRPLSADGNAVRLRWKDAALGAQNQDIPYPTGNSVTTW